MGFLDKIFGVGKAYSNGRNPRLACELTMDGEKFMLEEFDINFEMYHSEKQYVPLYATFLDKLSPELESWITRGYKRMDGYVRFFNNTENPDEGAVFSLSFYEAVCVRCHKFTRGEEPATTLVMAAKKIKLMEQEH
jgi:hypothetical protein